MIQQRTGIAVFAMIALLLTSGASATAKQRVKEGGMALPLPKIIAHRGGPGNWPPNTLCANNPMALLDYRKKLPEND